MIYMDGDAEGFLKGKEGTEHRAKSNRHGETLPGSGFGRRVITSENGVNRKVALTEKPLQQEK